LLFLFAGQSVPWILHWSNPKEKGMSEAMRVILPLAQRGALLVLLGAGTVLAQTAQEHVHGMAHTVMPFEMSQSVHIFKMTRSGGVQQVVAKDPQAADQIALIRQHLEHEATKFAHGDYSGPATLHGAAMPGLAELHAGAAGVAVTYDVVANGAAITFTTTDLALLTAIHRWFGAQLSEHGADARAE
jgi:hypothetical protein